MDKERPHILVVRLGAMGDVLHGMPAIAGLRKAFPRCSTGWIIEDRWEPLLRSAPGHMQLVDRLHCVRTREWRQRPFARSTLHEIAAVQREMAGERYDVCVDLQGAIKSAVLGTMARAKRLVGPSSPREGAAKLLYGESVNLLSVDVIGQACELMSAAVGTRIEAEKVSIPVDQEAERWCDDLLTKEQIEGFVLLVPSAGWGAKEWGADRYTALSRALRAKGLKVLINKAPGSKGVGGLHELASTLPQLIALTRRAALVVGGDSGPIHLAAALGRPVVALFGPTDPARTGPYLPATLLRVLRHARSVTDHRRHQETEVGLTWINVEEVLGACMDLLRTASVEGF